jgi:hypothetical protein
MSQLLASRPRSHEASGFVLVGVVMFILVLTILGLSLFSLSGFEAQFLNASLHRQDSYYIATGGVERAKWVLTRTNKLENVKDNMPEGVIYTTARQGVNFDDANVDSTGSIKWDSPDPVWIRALAEERGVKTYVEARFNPSEPEQIYKRVATSFTGVTGVDDTHSPQVNLNGEVWQNGSLTLYKTKFSGTDLTGNAPMPDVTSFYAAYLYAPGTLDASLVRSGTQLEVYLDSGTRGGPPVFYRTSGLVTNNVSGGYNTFHVRGTAVWMLPDGIDLQSRIALDGGPQDRLIIVARAVDGKSVGITLDAFEFYPGTPLILVSDSGIDFGTGWNSTTISTNIPYITMFGNGVKIMGPDPGQTLTLSHNSNLDEDVLEPLYDAEALPNTLGGTTGRTLKLQAGTWRQLPTAGL